MTLEFATEALRRAGVDSPEYDARELFICALGLGRSEIIGKNEDFSSPLLEEFIKRRIQREPLQYIIGEVGFYREEYTVTPDVLIPREDTETLVDFAVKNIPEGGRFIDLCTGSGCVAVSTLKNTKNTRALAVDISDGALAIARINAEKNGVVDRLELVKRDLLREPIPDFGEVFCILSNPPYVTESEYEELADEIYREPKCAFVGGEDGMDFYECLIPRALEVISDDGFLAFEIGYMQADAVSRIAWECNAELKILKDLSGNDRVAVIRKK